MRNDFLTLIMIISLNLGGSARAADLDRDLVPDSVTAIKVAGAILETYMGKDRFGALVSRKGALIAELDGDTWTVTFPVPTNPGQVTHNPDGTESIVVTAGGGTPEIEMSKRDAQVRKVSLSR